MNISQEHLERLIRELHSRSKLSVWSIVITVFGDAIVPRGGIVSLSSLQEIFSRLKIEPNALRTAMSRLAGDGWITRQKHGRQSSYALASEGEELFQSATQRIYANSEPDWPGGFEMAFVKPNAEYDSISLDKEMRSLGFGSHLQGFYIKPLGVVETSGLPDSVARFSGAEDLSLDVSKQMAIAAWPLSALAQQHKVLIERYEPLLNALKSAPLQNSLDYLAARILLVHDWRRVCLKDPGLPKELTPDNWEGAKARAMVAELYAELFAKSEAELDTYFAGPDEKLAPANASIRTRFAAK